jgi:hypothetical protein
MNLIIKSYDNLDNFITDYLNNFISDDLEESVNYTQTNTQNKGESDESLNRHETVPDTPPSSPSRPSSPNSVPGTPEPERNLLQPSSKRPKLGNQNGNGVSQKGGY